VLRILFLLKKETDINFLNQYQRQCWWRHGKARRNVYWAGMQRY